jgi:hypothetical protein
MKIGPEERIGRIVRKIDKPRSGEPDGSNIREIV